MWHCWSCSTGVPCQVMVSGYPSTLYEDSGLAQRRVAGDEPGRCALRAAALGTLNPVDGPRTLKARVLTTNIDLDEGTCARCDLLEVACAMPSSSR